MAESAPRGYHATMEISKFVNINNAKKLAFVLMIGFSFYHGYLMIKVGWNSCKWLLSEGHFQRNSYWQPDGCMVHHYSNRDARMCMKYIAYWGGESRFSFVGDSRLRELYFTFVNYLQSPDGDHPMGIREKHANCNYSDIQCKLNAKFLWQPLLDDTLYDLLRDWNSKPGAAREVPTLLLISIGSWAIKKSNGSREGVNEYQKNLTRIASQLSKLKNTRIVWMMQDPVAEELLWKNRSMITNRLIDEYNAAAQEIMDPMNIETWSSNRLIAKAIGFQSDQSDGLHASPEALSWDVQILLNMYCNNRMKFYDGTCCSIPEPITKTQMATFFVFGVCILVALSCIVYDYCYMRRDPALASRRVKPFILTHHRVGSDSLDDKWSMFAALYEVSTALAKFGAILGYFFVCDRTIFFMKENKAFTLTSFLLPLVYIFIVGVFFTESSQKTGMNHRDITDEWKGWMQLVILMYHITGASKLLPVYMHIRVLVSAYLFLSGYGHFTYFWTRMDSTGTRLCQRPLSIRSFDVSWKNRRNVLRRLFQVLFRLNFLVVGLCFVMNRPYQFYYFVPLVSFWFFITFVLMILWPQVNAESVERAKTHTLWMLIKLVVLFVLISLLNTSDFVFDRMFFKNPFRALFVASEDAPHEWRFRWALDRYSSVYGMMFAFFYHTAKQNRFILDNHQGDLFNRPLSIVLTGLGVLGILGYTAFSVVCPTKPSCNETHSYLTILPIFSYILLRNCIGSLRQKFSSLFAWFGRISLELFVAQYHIWLAADTQGVLVLIPGNQPINLLLTSFLFVCVSHEIQSLTHTLLPYAVPDDWRKLVRNLIVFTGVLTPIAISHGVFAS